MRALPGVIMLAAILAGVAFGALLAVRVVPVFRDICGSAPDCQRQLAALIGAVALMQALSIAVIYLLINRLNRQSEARLLSALQQLSEYGPASV